MPRRQISRACARARRFLGLCLVLLAAHSPLLRATLTAGAPQSAFDSANRLYEQSKFGEAREAYDSLVAVGGLSPNVFYNLGNADFRLGDPGKAILNYERALALDPSHPEARANIAFVRQETGARTGRPAWFDPILLPLDSSCYVMAAALAAWLFVFSLFWRRPDRPLLLLSAGLALLILLYCSIGIFALEMNKSLAIVTAKQGEARLEPLDSAGIAETLPAGSQVKVIRERGPWTYCSLPDETLAWLPSATIEKVRITRS